MTELEDNSVHLIVTSPPYWQLKDYGNAEQIGFNDSYEAYINNLNLVWSECFRVLHEGCRLCVNVGDQFARAAYYGRYKVIPIHSEIIRFCEGAGFDFMGQIIWQKSTTMNTSGGGVVMGSFPFPRNGIVKLDFEYILLFKKRGNAPTPSAEQKAHSQMTREEWNTFFSGHWHFNGAKQDRHLAMFPEELPRRLIKMFSFEGDVVLDPFLGSGTTALAAKNLQRNSIGYEINENFIPLIREKIGGNTLLENSETVEIKSPPITQETISELIKKLPYTFVDIHKTDKKIDIKKHRFGSKIDSTNAPLPKEEFFSVKEIISPELLRLNDGKIVRLLGVKQDVRVNGAAVKYLREKVYKKRIFLRYDEQKYDEQNNLLAYVYLENKTFINAHLIRDKMALIDESAHFKYRAKFQAL